MKQFNRDHPAKILVVDDEPQITRVLRTTLSVQGYLVRTSADGVDALATVRSWRPDLVITDLSMPLMNGVELCREIRHFSPTPIIVLSVRDQERMKIEALDAGADDYVTKPFSAQELQARVRVQLRRSPTETQNEATVHEVGHFRIDIPDHRVTVRGGEVRLTPKQFDLLIYMVEHPSRVLTHRALLHAVWGSDTDQPEYLRVHIGQLRKKIEPADEPQYIVTEPWIGYRFRPTGNDE